MEIGARHASVLRSCLYETEIAASAGLVERAEIALRAFEHWTPATLPCWIESISLRARGALEIAKDDPLGARATLQQAIVAADPEQVPFEAARTRLALGSALRRLRDYSEARKELSACRESFQQLGAAVWVASATTELARVPGRRSRESDELTQAERRIAALVADGHSNKEVASQLSVSVKTVETTLTRIYRKLDVRSRAQLAARARVKRDSDSIT